MARRRKVWQHDVSLLSVDQLKERLHNAGWSVVDIFEDYGEDLLVRVFHEGCPTGNDFYIQLKGTKRIEQYALKSGGYSYPIKAVSLKQWQRSQIPVVLIVWDVERKDGYWQHVQPFIEKSAKANAKWLDDPDSQRRVHLPAVNSLQAGELYRLSEAITTELDKLRLGKQSIEVFQDEQLERLRYTIESGVRTTPHGPVTKGFSRMHPQVNQQLLLAEYQAATLENPNDVGAWLQLAKVYYELNELDKALVAINEAWGLDDRDPQIINARAAILCEHASAYDGPKSMLREAIDLFASIRSGTSLPSAIDYNIGNCFAALGEHDKAIKYFEKALAGNPPPHLASQVWKNRGTSFSHAGNRAEEIRSYEEAIRIDPSRWEAYSSWAYAELIQGNYKSAKELFLKCFEVRPELARTGYAQMYSMAYALWKLDELEAAYSLVNQLLSLRPNHREGQLLKSHILSQLWRADPQHVVDALAFFKSRVIDHPEDNLARGELYLIYNSTNYKNEARVLIQETVGSSNAPAQSLYHYAKLLEEDGDIPKAIHYLELAYEKNTGHHIVHNLGRLKQKVGRFRAAIKFYKLALNGIKTPTKILRNIADCYHFSGNHKQSAKFEVAALLLDPRDVVLWSNLHYSLTQLGHDGLFSSFTDLLRKLRSDQNVANIQVEAAVDELLSRLTVTFGRQYVREIVTAVTVPRV